MITITILFAIIISGLLLLLGIGNPFKRKI